MGRPPLPVTPERYLARTRAVDDCLIWTGATAGGPRGKFALSTANGRPVLVHRIMHELAVGPIPEGHEVDHLCTNGLCINPEHLEAVTPAENKRRTAERGHSRNGNDDKTRCPQGHEYDVVRTRGDGRTFRACRRCERAAQARYRARTS